MKDEQHHNFLLNSGPIHVRISDYDNAASVSVMLNCYGSPKIELHRIDRGESDPFDTITFTSEGREAKLFVSPAQLDDLAEAIRAHREQTR